MKLFNNDNQSTREDRINRYKSARTDLIVIIALTVFNIVLLLFGSETFMIFSASVPYMAVIIGLLLNGGIDDVYIESGLEIGITVAFVILAIYFVCWLLSKKNYKWLTVATVLFCIDTLATIIMYSDAFIDGIIDIIIHILAVYFLITGVINGKKAKNMPEETVEADYTVENDKNVQLTHTTPLRYADDDRIKSRHLCTAEYMGLNIIYRRVKRTNELVVNGYVYDEIEMLMETDHELHCTVNGYEIAVGYTSMPSKSYIKVNGKTIKTKTRIW